MSCCTINGLRHEEMGCCPRLPDLRAAYRATSRCPSPSRELLPAADEPLLPRPRAAAPPPVSRCPPAREAVSRLTGEEGRRLSMRADEWVGV